MPFPTQSTILFQGDSITDTSRSREINQGHAYWALGAGYAMMLAARYLKEQPGDQLTFLNRGVSGNRIVDLYARILADTINLQPTHLSVLIGVNDTWHRFKHQNGIAVPKYARLYEAFLSEVREALPNIHFILAEPFVLPAGPVTDDWRAEIDERRAVVRELAGQFSAVLVPYQQAFDQALESAPATYWAEDGVHPTVAGHALMAEVWHQAVAPSLPSA